MVMLPFVSEISDAAVSVRPNPAISRFSPSNIAMKFVLLGIGIFLLTVLASLLINLRLATSLRIAFESWLIVAATLFVVLRLLWEAVRGFFPSGQSLTCDREVLTIGHIPTFNLSGKWVYTSFPVSEIRQFRAGAIRTGHYGVTPGLLFTAGGKERKILGGLEIIEADPVICGVAHLGVDTVRDPALPMMLEMALERRKRKLWSF